MKNQISKEDISKAVGNIREDYILEAEAYRISKNQKSKTKRISPAACFSVGLVACACLVFYLVFGESNLMKIEPDGESVLKEETQGSEASTSGEQDAASNKSTEEAEPEIEEYNGKVNIQGTIIDGTDGDIASIIVEVDVEESEVDYKEVMFYLDEETRAWCYKVGSLVRITCGTAFIDMAFAVGELMTIEELETKVSGD